MLNAKWGWRLHGIYVCACASMWFGDHLQGWVVPPAARAGGGAKVTYDAPAIRVRVMDVWHTAADPTTQLTTQLTYHSSPNARPALAPPLLQPGAHAFHVLRPY
jgi:hypothetical protein